LTNLDLYSQPKTGFTWARGPWGDAERGVISKVQEPEGAVPMLLGLTQNLRSF